MVGVNRDQQRMRRHAAGGTIELGRQPVEELHAVALRLVADVVGQAGEPVDRQEVVPDRSGEKSQRHRKILVGPPVPGPMQCWATRPEST